MPVVGRNQHIMIDILFCDSVVMQHTHLLCAVHRTQRRQMPTCLFIVRREACRRDGSWTELDTLSLLLTDFRRNDKTVSGDWNNRRSLSCLRSIGCLPVIICLCCHCGRSLSEPSPWPGCYGIVRHQIEGGVVFIPDSTAHHSYGWLDDYAG